ncbi:MAG TPA: gamma-glutamyl-gamma-aminobutyrate hydrolase family protein [Clostridia bacterium]|nr:gamma-glutamyl-gamma-aminobutyrate hydrolase family protein [Clostridia bacterium]
MKPLILLTAGYELSQNGQNRRYLYQSYADAVTRAGGIPLLPLDNGELAKDLVGFSHGLLITGGPDIDPSLYGEEKLPECGNIDSQRDAMEYKLLEHFVKANKPVFGICRGIQIINCYFGGSLWQDLPSQLGLVHSGGDKPHDCVHMTELMPGSQLQQLYGSRMLTNSYHHQSVKALAEGFVCTATCGEVVEAMEHILLPISAVQWHPERMTGINRFLHHGPDSGPLFSIFIERCKAQ